MTPPRIPRDAAIALGVIVGLALGLMGAALAIFPWSLL